MCRGITKIVKDLGHPGTQKGVKFTACYSNRCKKTQVVIFKLNCTCCSTCASKILFKVYVKAVEECRDRKYVTYRVQGVSSILYTEFRVWNMQYTECRDQKYGTCIMQGSEVYIAQCTASCMIPFNTIPYL